MFDEILYAPLPSTLHCQIETVNDNIVTSYKPVLGVHKEVFH